MPNIPNRFLELANSAELFDMSEKIGKEFGLHVDQIGELDAQIRAVLRGQAQPNTFTEDIKRYLEIDGELAGKIKERVNSDIFEVIKSELKTTAKSQSQEASSITEIEKMGQFQIEHKDMIVEKHSPRLPDRSSALASIEDPSPVKDAVAPQPSPDLHTDPLVDHLLSKPTAAPEKKIVAPVPETLKAQLQQKPAPAAPRGGPDPYREPIQ